MHRIEEWLEVACGNTKKFESTTGFGVVSSMFKSLEG